MPVAQKPKLVAKSVPGQVARYEIQSHTVTTGETTTPIANPEGASKFTDSVRLVVTVKSLEPKVMPDGLQLNRFVATFDQSARDADSDTLDLSDSGAGDAFAAVVGHSVQYVLDLEGRVRDVEGLEELFRDKALGQPVLKWLSQLSASTRLPARPVSIGEKWKTDRPSAGMPFNDISWHSESTYLRNEPCRLYARPGAQPSADRTPELGNGGREKDSASHNDCAVLLTRFEISRRGSPNSDATPDEYLHNSLRTSGKWTGSGESLDSISLDDGVLVSSSQSSSQDLDLVIKSAATSANIRRQAHSETHTEIVLLR
jgi:hypothetical protein